MEFHTNDFSVARLQLAYEMSKNVSEIENTHVPFETNKDELIIKRAKLITKIYHELIPPQRS